MNENSDKSTPRPWTFGEGDKFRLVIKKVSLFGKSFEIARPPGLSEVDEANIKLIVKAVNAFKGAV